MGQFDRKKTHEFISSRKRLGAAEVGRGSGGGRPLAIDTVLERAHVIATHVQQHVTCGHPHCATRPKLHGNITYKIQQNSNFYIFYELPHLALEVCTLSELPAVHISIEKSVIQLQLKSKRYFKDYKKSKEETFD